MAKPAKEQAPRPRCRAVNIRFINETKPTIGGCLKIIYGLRGKLSERSDRIITSPEQILI